MFVVFFANSILTVINKVLSYQLKFYEQNYYEYLRERVVNRGKLRKFSNKTHLNSAYATLVSE